MKNNQGKAADISAELIELVKEIELRNLSVGLRYSIEPDSLLYPVFQDQSIQLKFECVNQMGVPVVKIKIKTSSLADAEISSEA